MQSACAPAYQCPCANAQHCDAQMSMCQCPCANVQHRVASTIKYTYFHNIWCKHARSLQCNAHRGRANIQWKIKWRIMFFSHAQTDRLQIEIAKCLHIRSSMSKPCPLKPYQTARAMPSTVTVPCPSHVLWIHVQTVSKSVLIIRVAVLQQRTHQFLHRWGHSSPQLTSKWKRSQWWLVTGWISLLSGRSGRCGSDISSGPWRHCQCPSPQRDPLPYLPRHYLDIMQTLPGYQGLEKV